MSEKFLFRVAMNRSYADVSEFIIMINITVMDIYTSNVEVSERRRQILIIIMRTILMIIT